MKLDPAQLEPAQRYKLLVGSITPRPIAFVSSLSPEGHLNLAPFSFFNAASADPMAIVFCPFTKGDGGMKDTLRNVLPAERGGLGEFVVNVAVEGYVRRMTACAEVLPYGESEFEMSGLTPVDSEVVRPPRVKESPVSFECRTLQIVELAPGVPMSGSMVVGEVVQVHVRDDVVDERLRVDQDALATVGRMGGPSYCRSRDRFDLPRGRDALSATVPFDDDA